MKPLSIENIPNEILLKDIRELTQEFPLEFPHLFEKIQKHLNIDTKNIFIIEFFEDENQDNHFYGYFFDTLNKKLYQYSFENEQSNFKQVDIKDLPIQNIFFNRVLPLL